MNKKIVFLCSGGGGNLRFLQAYQKENSAPYEIVAVIADRACNAIEFAKQEKIPFFQVVYNRNQTEELTQLLLKINPDLVITNIHKILHKDLVEQFAGRLINLHYSLLPAFQGMLGMDSIKAALQQGCRFVGTTAHYVDEQVDHGKILTQTVLTVQEQESFTTLSDRVFRAGCFTLLNAVILLCSANAAAAKYYFDSIGGQVSSDSYISPKLFAEEFWKSI